MGGYNDIGDVKAIKRVSNVEAQDSQSHYDCTYFSQRPISNTDSFTWFVLFLLLPIF